MFFENQTDGKDLIASVKGSLLTFNICLFNRITHKKVHEGIKSVSIKSLYKHLTACDFASSW